jgi:Mn2+/Fe2+ NRAMP family transporter
LRTEPAFRIDARGLRVAQPLDAAALERERAWLAELAGRPRGARWWAYLRHGGPGYLQSALTLGGGTASACLLSGAAFGYELLWVAPAGILTGAVVLLAVGYQTLSTGVRPLEAMRIHAGPFYAWCWALGCLLASLIWHFAQYSLGSALLVDLAGAFGAAPSRPAMGALILVWALASAQLFASGSRAMQAFDRLLTLFVWGIVLCFGAVVAATGISDWDALLRGFVAFRIPAPSHGVSGFEVALAGIAAAVVVNMVFLYPHTLLARGWGREHRSLARFDLFAGLVIPYVLVTSLIVVATANTVHAQGLFAGKALGPVEAANVLASVLGGQTGRVMFDLGVLGMVLTTITMHMVCAAFACSELFGWDFGSARYRLALLLPTPGVLGSIWWQELSVWVAVPTSILVAFFLPVTYLGFVKLQRSRAYLGDDLPKGRLGGLWLAAMIGATALISGFLALQLYRLVAGGP